MSINTNVKDILGGKRILSISPNELSAPIEVLVEVTWKCNLKCMHCMMSAEYYEDIELTYDEMDTQVLKNLIDDCCEAGVAHIDLSGGEPLLREDILEIIQYASYKEVKPCLLTNGILIDDNMAKKLKEAGVYKVEMNLDGHTSEIYDKFRGVPGAFDKTIRAIKAVLSNNIPLRINVMFCKPLYPYFEDIIKLAAELNVVELCFAPLRMAGEALNNVNKLAFSPMEYASILPEMIELKMRMQEKYKMVILFLGDYGIEKYIDPKKVFPNCGAGRLHCTVGADGGVRPCPAFPTNDEFIAGNINQRSIIDIWRDGEIFKNLRKPDIKGCENCEEINCIGGCRRQSLWKYNDVLKGPDPYCMKVLTSKIKESYKGGND